MAVDTDNLPSYTKDPDAVLDYHWNWKPYLSDGEIINTSTFFVSPGILVGVTASTTTDTTLWLSGGQIGKVYRCTNRIVTNQGRTEDRSINVRVRDR